MLFVSGSSPFIDVTSSVFEFFISSYEIRCDVEICYRNLTNENALGFSEVNGEEWFVQIHNDMTKEETIKTIFHELVHVVQNENGIFLEDEREEQAYDLEEVLYNNYCASEGTVHNSGTDPQNRVS